MAKSYLFEDRSASKRSLFPNTALEFYSIESPSSKTARHGDLSIWVGIYPKTLRNVNQLCVFVHQELPQRSVTIYGDLWILLRPLETDQVR
jgi:hypothetical protein